MGAEISAYLAQDAAQSLNGVVCERELLVAPVALAPHASAATTSGSNGGSSSGSTSGSPATPTTATTTAAAATGSTSKDSGAFRRTASDVARREQLFAFCADWDVARVSQFLRWYARLAQRRARADGSGERDAELSNQLATLHQRVDALEQDIGALQDLLDQIDAELETALFAARAADSRADDGGDSASGGADGSSGTAASVRGGDGGAAASSAGDLDLRVRPGAARACVYAHAHAHATATATTAASSDSMTPSPAAVLRDLEASKHDAEHALRAKLLALRELKQHLLASIEDADLSAVVRWPIFIAAITHVHLQTSATAHARASAEQHPATAGYAMARDARAPELLAELAKGDLLLPPLANHEIDGFTDDSASTSAASGDGSDGGDVSEDDDEGDEGVGGDADATDGAGDGESSKPSAAGAGAKGGDSDDDEDDDEGDDEGESGDVEANRTATDGNVSARAKATAVASPATAAPETGSDAPPDAPAALTPATLAAHTAAASAVAAIPYRDTLKRPRVIPRVVPELFDAHVRSPVFFGYTLAKAVDDVAEAENEQSALLQREAAIFEAKIADRRAKLERTLASERGKLDVLAQRERDVRLKRERHWQKRAAELERAKKELDPTDLFFRTHDAQDKRTRDQEAHDDTEMQRQRAAIDARMTTAQTQFDATVAEIARIRTTEYPLGDARLVFHEAEMDAIQSEIHDAKRALAAANDEYVALKTSKTLVIPGQEGKLRAQLLVAEDQIKARERELASVCTVLENELFLLARAQTMYEREQLFLPFFLCLNGGACTSETRTSFALLEAATALLLGVGGSRVDEKIRFLFDMFAHKTRRLPPHSSTAAASATTVDRQRERATRRPGLADGIAVLPRESFAGLLGVLLKLFAKIGDMHPPRGLSPEYLLGLAEREFVRLEIARSARDESSASPPSGMTCFEFEQYCIDVAEKSKYLCELLRHPWKYEQLSRFVLQHMSVTHQHRLGLLNINDLKFAVARQVVQAREELSRWRKLVIHERALAMGENDPLKTDYSKYLPKRRAKLLSNVVPLDHGGYRNLLHYRMEVILRATVKLQTSWRARKGRQVARLAAEKQAFYHARGVALEAARAAVESEWRAKDTKPAHSVEKMKFEAKLRMKQVKLRTKGTACSREQVFALLMEDAVQLAQREVENRFREMEEELGYLPHATALALPHADTTYLQAEISSALVGQLHRAKQETAQVHDVLEAIAHQEALAQQKAQAKKDAAKRKRMGGSSDGDANGSSGDVPETDVAAVETEEKHLVDTHATAQRALESAARTDAMAFGRFPAALHQHGLTSSEHATQMALASSDPPLLELQRRLQHVCVGMTTFKLTEFLQELPSKRHICAYVSAFRRFDGSYDTERLATDLFEHFRMVRGAEELADALVGIAESDLECGETRKLLQSIQDAHDAALGELVATQTGRVAEANAAVVAKKLVRMGYSISSAASGTSDAEAASPTALLVQKEQHELSERKKRALEAHARLQDAMRAWRDAELALLETERSQLRVSPAYPVLPRHRTKWAERLQHALRLPERDAQQLAHKYTEVRSVCQDFLETASAIARVLVRELFLPLRDKSILPTGASTIDGRSDDVRSTKRLKYEAHDIVFKVCTDDHGRFEGSHELAAKFGGHEVRNSALYLRALNQRSNVVLPLQCCVDFQGFRVLCASKLALDIVVVDDTGSASQKVSRQLVLGSADRGKTVVFQSKELDSVLADAAAQLNLSRHGVRGYQDLTSKTVHAPADMLGYVDANKQFALLRFARAMPPEDPEVTPHLAQSTRGMSILWRQLRPELVRASATPLSSDALSAMTYCTPDWQAQSLAVESATQHLVDIVIPAFARKLSQKPDYFTAASFDLTAELHRHGINVRHLGVLRAQFRFALAGTATLQYATAEIATTEDFTRELERGAHVCVNGAAAQVSRDAQHRFDATCVTLTRVHTGSSVQHVTVYSGRAECAQHATAIRARLLAEMVARTFKNLARHAMRTAAQLAGTGVAPHRFRDTVVQLLNLLSGARVGSEAFWTTHVFEGVRARFGRRAVSEVDRLNLRRALLPQLAYIVRRSTAMLGSPLAPVCLERLAQHPDCYAFTTEDFAHNGDGDAYCVKHNLSMLHFSAASLLLLQATVTQATSYKQLVLADRPSGYWPLCERRGLSTAANLGTYGRALAGKYLPGCTLEADGPIATNMDLNRAVAFRKEARSYIAFPFVEALYPRDAAAHVTLETWCRCDGHESTRRVVLTLGRFSLSALKSNAWACTVNVQNVDISAFGSRVELGKWTHLVGAFDGTVLRLFVDGLLQSEVEVESVVDAEIAKREAVIAKTRADIADLEDDARGACFKDVDREMQALFATKDGKAQIKALSQKLLDEHDFRVRLSTMSA